MDTDAKIKEYITGACRTPAERSLMYAMWGEIKMLKEKVVKLEVACSKPKPDTVTKPPPKKTESKGGKPK